MTEDGEQLQEFLAALQVGSHDDELDEIEEALNYRRKVLLKRTIKDLTPGSTVRFKAARPKYLTGLTAEVVRVDEGHVWVKTPDDPAYRKYRASAQIKCPLSIIEVA